MALASACWRWPAPANADQRRLALCGVAPVFLQARSSELCNMRSQATMKTHSRSTRLRGPFIGCGTTFGPGGIIYGYEKIGWDNFGAQRDDFLAVKKQWDNFVPNRHPNGKLFGL